ncbi:AMP-binding protein [Streptomyces sp. NPDC002889]|uniref:AMP-binding protein n=1 Tax=Streptomyces sp. NPDC002889 TaxID=3364669 RepID=UPI00369A3E99
MICVPDPHPGISTVAFAADLAAFGDRTAVITADARLTYSELAKRVEATARALGSERRLVLLVGGNDIGALVVYLAALAAGHPVLLVPGGNPAALRSLIDAYDPDVVASPTGDGEWGLDERRAVSTHSLHPDLALLLSTSGSTGSPKLVRLSHDNLQSNAESIARYLAIREDDRAATTLPLHYCYGLSVVNSHLLRGAGLILTGLSVADTCFWDLFRDNRGTTFAGVPYTFDLLDRVGFASMELPALRYVTQAGGRLSPDRVARFAALGRRDGWDLYVMYGQTEATARMAYLPPGLAESRPQAIGVPVPGGSFRLRPHPDWPEPATGELVYSGPNVMLGYAKAPQDLALGRTIDELRTGDIARLGDDGLYEVIGRHSRFAKILGLRIDPQQVELTLEQHGVTACCLGHDDELVVAVMGETDAQRIRRLVAQTCALPPRAVRVCELAELPRLASGKPDHRAVRELTRAAGDGDAPSAAVRETSAASRPGGGTAELCALYAEILDRTDVTEDATFVGLGGDSLSYVEMSIRLEQALGHLPADWHIRPIRSLEPAERPARSRRRRTVETGVALRAMAIVLIVGSHIHLFSVKGGAHLLLAVAGFNFARFHLTAAPVRERARNLGRSIGNVALPSMIWIALIMLLTGAYSVPELLLLESFLGADGGETPHFWFVEALVHILVVVTVVLSVPAVDRLQRRFPFALPLALVALALLIRYDLLGIDARDRLPSAAVVFWLFALGWAAAKAATVPRRALVTVAAVATVPGFFPGEPWREALITAGFALLVWIPGLPSTAAFNKLAGVLAGSSLYIYLTHWQLIRLLEDQFAVMALLGALAFGVAYATLATRLARALRTCGGRGGRKDAQRVAGRTIAPARPAG